MPREAPKKLAGGGNRNDVHKILVARPTYISHEIHPSARKWRTSCKYHHLILDNRVTRWYSPIKALALIIRSVVSGKMQ